MSGRRSGTGPISHPQRVRMNFTEGLNKLQRGKWCYFTIVPSRACSFHKALSYIYVPAYFLSSPLEHKLPKGRDLISFIHR